MRLAGRSDAIEPLARHVAGQGLSGAEDAASERMDAFFRVYELLLSKGYSAPAAQVLAVKMIDGQEPMAKTTRRFAGVHDDPPPDL